VEVGLGARRVGLLDWFLEVRPVRFPHRVKRSRPFSAGRVPGRQPRSSWWCPFGECFRAAASGRGRRRTCPSPNKQPCIPLGVGGGGGKKKKPPLVNVSRLVGHVAPPRRSRWRRLPRRRSSLADNDRCPRGGTGGGVSHPFSGHAGGWVDPRHNRAVAAGAARLPSLWTFRQEDGSRREPWREPRTAAEKDAVDAKNACPMPHVNPLQGGNGDGPPLSGT